MMTMFLILAGMLFCSYFMMALALRNAPEGYEDESGFHLVWCNHSPEARDVACIWAGQAEILALAGMQSAA